MFITYRFISNAKYHLGCLGFRPKQLSDFDKSSLKNNVVDKMFRLKDISNSFVINYHYSWIVKHWEKLLQAFVHEKWQSDIPYSKIDVSLCREKYENVAFVTNMFDKKIEGFYLDNAGNVVQSSFLNSKKRTCQTLDKVYDENDETDYIYTTKYLDSLKGNEAPKINNSIGSIDLSFVEAKKKIMLAFIVFDVKKAQKFDLIELGKDEIVASLNSIRKTEELNSVIAFGFSQNMLRRH